VAKVYPELVIRNESGRIDGVRYDELVPLLLSEVQQQQRINAAQAEEIQDLKRHQIATQQQVAALMNLNHATQFALRKLPAKDEIIAGR
jgi:hypothetical protein